MQPEMGQFSLQPKIWGLSAVDLHAAWWRGKGVQVVYAESKFEPLDGAEVYLLLPKDRLVVFDLGDVVDELIWNMAAVTTFTLCERDTERYREEVRRSADKQIIGISRSYESRDLTQVRMELTTDPAYAEVWARGSRGQPYFEAPVGQRSDSNLDGDLLGHAFDSRQADEQRRFLLWLVASWVDLPRVLPDIVEIEPGVFAFEGTLLPEDGAVISPMWLGFPSGSRELAIHIGPDLRYDQESQENSARSARILPIREIQIPDGRRRKRFLPRRTVYGVVKRVSDFLVAILAIIILFPMFLLVSVLIVIDDGFPLFFGHTRQTRGGRDFKCWKFRTMRRNAESMVEELQALNQADGPQVFIENDPRVTGIGNLLRKLQIDEIPQFWNVVRGEMSFVGPRPSPERENQFCPAWRELRLSVRPGITGLWQVSRTRAPGEDFQEWIKYDIEYVRTASLLVDLKILLRTIRGIIIRD